MCLSTRGESQFPRVLLQPLGHLSVENQQLTVTRNPRFFADCDESSKGDALTLAAIKYTVMNAGLE